MAHNLAVVPDVPGSAPSSFGAVVDTPHTSTLDGVYTEKPKVRSDQRMTLISLCKVVI